MYSGILWYTSSSFPTLRTRPLIIEKESLVNGGRGGGGGGNCTLWNVWNFTNCCIACRAFCGTRHTHKHSVFPAWCLQLSKVKQNAKMVLVQLAFPIIAHQICKSQSEVRLHTGCSVHFHTIPFTRPSYSIFRGSGSETTPSQCCCSSVTCTSLIPRSFQKALPIISL